MAKILNFMLMYLECTVNIHVTDHITRSKYKIGRFLTSFLENPERTVSNSTVSNINQLKFTRSSSSIEKSVLCFFTVSILLHLNVLLKCELTISDIVFTNDRCLYTWRRCLSPMKSLLV